MTREGGITLVELIVVISIIGILVVAFGFSFQNWRANYNIESEVKQIYTDLTNARLMAVQRHHQYFADFPSTTSYRIREDHNDNGNWAVTTDDWVVLNGIPMPVPPALITSATSLAFPVTWAGGTIVFDTTGIAQLQPSGSLSGVICVPGTYNPDYDCIAILQTKITMGKMTTAGGSCDATNCVVK